MAAVCEQPGAAGHRADEAGVRREREDRRGRLARRAVLCRLQQLSGQLVADYLALVAAASTIPLRAEAVELAVAPLAIEGDKAVRDLECRQVLDDDASGTYGYLTDKGLIPLGDAEREAIRDAAMSLKALILN